MDVKSIKATLRYRISVKMMPSGFRDLTELIMDQNTYVPDNVKITEAHYDVIAAPPDCRVLRIAMDIEVPYPDESMKTEKACETTLREMIRTASRAIADMTLVKGRADEELSIMETSFISETETKKQIKELLAKDDGSSDKPVLDMTVMMKGIPVRIIVTENDMSVEVLSENDSQKILIRDEKST